MSNIEIVFVSTKEEAESFKEQGYCPVECAFGDESVIDDLKMDHHGEFGYLGSVSSRAYQDHYGARKNDPRFVINHVDADNTFAIAALAGILPNSETGKDLTGLAQTVAMMDTDPIGRDVLQMTDGDILATWQKIYSHMEKDAVSASSAVYGWQTLTTSPDVAPFLEVGKQAVIEVRETAKEEMHRCGHKNGDIFVLSGVTVDGFNEWYGRNMDADPHTLDAWKNPVVAALNSKKGIRIACPNDEIAELIFGKGGLENVFARLNENPKYKDTDGGFGGRVSVGGSPRKMEMEAYDLKEIANAVNSLIVERNKDKVCYISFVRHAEYNRETGSLTDRGIQEMGDLALYMENLATNRLSDFNQISFHAALSKYGAKFSRIEFPDIILTSPEKRAEKSGRALQAQLKALGINVPLVEGVACLAEVNETQNDLQRNGHGFIDPQKVPELVKMDFYQNMMSELKKYMEKGYKNIVVITHQPNIDIAALDLSYGYRTDCMLREFTSLGCGDLYVVQTLGAESLGKKKFPSLHKPSWQHIEECFKESVGVQALPIAIRHAYELFCTAENGWKILSLDELRLAANAPKKMCSKEVVKPEADNVPEIT